MPHWIFRLGRLFRLRRKRLATEDPPSIHEEQVHRTVERKPMKQLKTLGDVVDHLENSEDLEKKEIGQPLLGKEMTVRTDKKDHKPTSLPVSRALSLTLPATCGHFVSSDCSVDSKIWEFTRRSQNIPQLFGSVKAHSAESINGRKPGIEKTATWRHNSDVTTQRTTEAPTISITESSQKSPRPNSRGEMREPWPQHTLLHITPGGEVKHSRRRISEVCDSEKVIEGPVSILVTKPPPESHRSLEDFIESLIPANDPEKPTRIPPLDAKMNVIRVARDSLVTKSEERSIPAIPDTMEIESVEAMDACATSPIIPLERIVPDKNTKNGDTSTSASSEQQQRQQIQSSSDGYVERDPSKNEIRRMRRRSRKLRSTRKLKRRHRASQTSEEEMEGNEHGRSPSTGALSSGSMDSGWCRQVCDKDRMIRKLSRTGERTCVRRTYGSCRRCTLRAGIFDCTDRTDHCAVVQDLPLACSQGVRIKTNQADVMLEDLISSLARDVAGSILSRATYAKSISSRTHRRTALLLRALLGCQYPGTPDSSSASLSVLSSSQKSISHTND
ncbi:hypothetical protein T265_02767 [Opisthorchis viverrini]|uniref:Uncharacterized protein n=1 Tax=Opisthorchis viverrini TaxID=6198 RepID=A0A075A5Q5_OPIVI|nr:hypothetical protein T265_02767 [Opisthorchis viverrini]KER30960.1 hypothetical protein T265_02767 [Opisthorchis viverrini]